MGIRAGLMSGAGGGFAGTVDGSFFRAPRWIDLAKPPGHTKQVAPTWDKWLATIAQLKHVVLSPNLIWLAMTAVVYIVWPYDFEAAREWRWDWIRQRFILNYAVTFTYYAFWEVTLYGLQWSQREFRPECWPTLPRMAH